MDRISGYLKLGSTHKIRSISLCLYETFLIRPLHSANQGIIVCPMYRTTAKKKKTNDTLAKERFFPESRLVLDQESRGG